MFPYPSQKFFRQMLLFGLIVWLSMFIVEATNYDVNSHEEEKILTWNYFGSLLPPPVSSAIYWIQTILYGIGLIAMIFLKGWGRFLILASIIVDFLSTTFLGLVVTTGAMDMLNLLAGTLIGIPLVLSFFDPCSSYFTHSKKQAQDLRS